tara:strand:+ start:88 stop:594 length:507 start_codon:yes stop_codon:yes gene_type:complete
MLKIAITGPESSGKTTLSAALAEHYKVSYIPEFARTYLGKTKGQYQQLDLDIIAQGQLKSLDSFKGYIAICDTDFSVLELWSQYKYNSVSHYIKELVSKDFFDLHVLCAPDIPWEPDPLRETPNSRDALFELYKTNLKTYKKNFIVVNDTHENRFKKSVQAIDLLIKF